MTGNVRGVLRLAVIFGLCVDPIAMAGDAWARGPGGAGRARPHVSREGPAQRGSFQPTQARESTRPNERPAPGRSTRTDPSDRRDARPDRMDARRAHQGERDRDREMDDRRNERRDDYDDRRDDRRDYYDDRRDDRRDYYDDRRHFARGARYSASWWTRSCSRATIVIADGYTYYRCDDVWFSRTYYGGEVIYTVTDAPSGS